jgi:hypothetical protein
MKQLCFLNIKSVHFMLLVCILMMRVIERAVINGKAAF